MIEFLAGLWAFSPPATVLLVFLPVWCVAALCFRSSGSQPIRLAPVARYESDEVGEYPTEIVTHVEHHHYHHHEVTHQHVMQGSAESAPAPRRVVEPPMIVPGSLAPPPVRKGLPG